MYTQQQWANMTQQQRDAAWATHQAAGVAAAAAAAATHAARPAMSAGAHVAWLIIGLCTCGVGWIGWAIHAIAAYSSKS